MDDRRASYGERFAVVPMPTDALVQAEIRERATPDDSTGTYFCRCAQANAAFVCAALNAAARREQESTLFTTDTPC